jgi:hypothetical protein
MKRLCVCVYLLAGCVKAPDIILVDRKTALEQQAAGSFTGLEDELEQAGVSPRPTPFTHGQLAASGAAGATRALDEDEAQADPVRVDALLTRRCVGEARDGTLVETSSTCTGTLDVAALTRLIERTNRSRLQVWRYLQSKRPHASLDDVRRAWREAHLQSVVCGGQVQRDDGGWEAKKC